MILNEVEDSQENYFTIMESYGLSKVSKETEKFDFHTLTYNLINQVQQIDPKIKKMLRKNNSNYHIKDFHGGGKTRALVCYKDKIVVPTKLQKHVIDWYHTVLCHPGINRTEETISQHLY